MVCLHRSISFDHMAKSMNSAYPYLKLRQTNQERRTMKTTNSLTHLNVPACHRSRSAVFDVVILIAVLGASSFLLYSSVKPLLFKLLEILGEIVSLVKEEVIRTPIIYIFLGLSVLCAWMAVLVLTLSTTRKCGKPGCRGLRKSPEFDIQLKTDGCTKNSTDLGKDSVKKGLLQDFLDPHGELEAELRKMAPPNGRAVIVFRGSCGCSIGSMEVPGPRKLRKFKK